MTSIYDLPISTKDDAFTLFCGNRLGGGMTRVVYEFGYGKSDFVIKCEAGQGHQNSMEFAVWKTVSDEHKSLMRWFAPCTHISDFGRWLIQRRTRPVTIDELRKELPKVPAFFSDMKVGNWGRLGKQIVCHDYGSYFVLHHGLTKAMRRAEWWE